jgi:diguanylate cyclase (GGDEF)-like protein
MKNKLLANTLWLLAALSIGMAIAGLELLSGRDFSFSIFYLVPIVLAAWFANRNAAVLVAFISVVGYFYIDSSLDTVYANRLAPYWNASSRLGIYLIVILILSSLRQSLAREKELARLDQATGAANRRWFFEKAEDEVRRALRYQRPISIAYIDIDDFKAVNDRLGHLAGDNLQNLVSYTMRNHGRATDRVARLGGDECVLLMPETGYTPAEATLTRVVESLALVTGQYDRVLTFSVGAVTFASPPRTVDELLSKADRVMYDVKAGGKNRSAHKLIGQPLPAL